MKKSATIILFLLLMGDCFARSADSIVYKSENIRLTNNRETGSYKLLTNKTYHDLIFVKRVFSYFQILDGNNQVFTLEQMEKEKMK